MDVFERVVKKEVQGLGLAYGYLQLANRHDKPENLAWFRSKSPVCKTPGF